MTGTLMNVDYKQSRLLDKNGRNSLDNGDGLSRTYIIPDSLKDRHDELKSGSVIVLIVDQAPNNIWAVPYPFCKKCTRRDSAGSGTLSIQYFEQTAGVKTTAQDLTDKTVAQPKPSNNVQSNTNTSATNPISRSIADYGQGTEKAYHIREPPHSFLDPRGVTSPHLYYINNWSAPGDYYWREEYRLDLGTEGHSQIPG